RLRGGDGVGASPSHPVSVIPPRSGRNEGKRPIAEIKRSALLSDVAGRINVAENIQFSWMAWIDAFRVLQGASCIDRTPRDSIDILCESG
ncbi:MAG: hypothetical protein KKB78_03465, partial [Alphaproteobacteria bacterium]|nr:hypothetical protein [Alphaproteobacteria bacterium]